MSFCQECSASADCVKLDVYVFEPKEKGERAVVLLVAEKASLLPRSQLFVSAA